MQISNSSWSCKDGLLYRVFELKGGEDHLLQLVVTTKFQKEVLHQLHDK